MRRKIIKQGTATLTVSLPAKWTRKWHLGPGHEVFVTESGNALTLFATPTRAQRAITFAITATNRADIQPLITHAYRKGYDTITLTGVTDSLAHEIHRICQDLLLGFEVLERSSQSLVLSSLSEPTEQKYDALLRRIFLLIKEMQSTTASHVASSRFDLAIMQSLRAQHDKLSLFCKRLLSKNQPAHAILHWELITFLTHISHAYYYLYSFAAEHHLKSSRFILELLRDAGSYYELLYTAYYQQDIHVVHTINKRKNDLQFGKCYRYLQKSTGPETVVLSHLREILRLIQLTSSPIVALLSPEEQSLPVQANASKSSDTLPE